MKKLFTLFVCAIIALATYAQIVPGKDSPRKLDRQKFEKMHPFKSTTKSNERWYNYGETMDAFYTNTSVLYGNNLFPDTTILVDYGTSGYSGPWIHMIGDVLDVKSSFFNDLTLHPGELALSAQSTYTIDSIGILGIYERNLNDPNVVDTLMIEVTVNNNLQTPYFAGSGINTNLGSDTVFIHLLNYSYQANVLNYSSKKVYKFPMDAQFAADTLDNGFNYIEVSTADLPTVNAGKYVVTAVSFIPGYTWVANVDTLIQKNRFFFVSFKEQDAMFPIYVKRDFNISYLVPQDVRYNDAGTWNGYLVPSYAYMGTSADYSYEHHLIYYKATCATNCYQVGVEQTPATQAELMGDAYPNPASESQSVIVPLNITSPNARFTVKNILGQVIMSYDNLNVGKQEISINTNHLAGGIYLYAIETGNTVITKKLSITK